MSSFRNPGGGRCPGRRRTGPGRPQPDPSHARHDARQPRAAHEQGRYDRAFPRHQDHHGPCRPFLGEDPKDPVTGKNTSFAAGEPCGFIIEFENGFKIYHMGDTGLFGEMKLIGEYYNPDMVLIPIGGHYVIDPEATAYASPDRIKPRMAWPVHYASNPFLRGTPTEYEAAMGQTSIEVIDATPVARSSGKS